MLTKTTTSVTDGVSRKLKHSFFQSKKRLSRYGLLAANLAIVFGVATFMISARGSSSSAQAPVLNLASDQEISDPLDALSGADIAVNVALMTGMPQTTAVVNHADSASTQDDVVPNGSQAISKPQILRTELKSKNDVQEYVVAEGDSIDEVAKRFGVTSKSIKWSNSLTSSTLKVGSTIVIPPVEGIVYTVKAGDTAGKLASKYKGDESRIVAFNDAEIDGLVLGDRIVIPDGEIVPPPRPIYKAAAGNFRAAYGPGNGYDWGWCTWHAANRRIQSGKPIPRNLGNAVTWSSRARASGMAVLDTPVAGAIIWHDQSVIGRIAGGLGHVGYVETVNADGSIIVSDMNSRGFANPDATGARAGGWSRISYRKITPDQFNRYDFIY